jgi:hypothetical protein
MREIVQTFSDAEAFVDQLIKHGGDVARLVMIAKLRSYLTPHLVANNIKWDDAVAVMKATSYELLSTNPAAVLAEIEGLHAPCPAELLVEATPKPKLASVLSAAAASTKLNQDATARARARKFEYVSNGFAAP